VRLTTVQGDLLRIRAQSDDYQPDLFRIDGDRGYLAVLAPGSFLIEIGRNGMWVTVVSSVGVGEIHREFVEAAHRRGIDVPSFIIVVTESNQSDRI
jgi:hypothetical protein